MSSINRTRSLNIQAKAKQKLKPFLLGTKQHSQPQGKMQKNMNGQKVLVRQSVKVMVGEKMISEKLIFEKPIEKPVVAPQPPPPIQRPVTPPISPSAKDRPGFLEPLPSPKAEAFRKAFLADIKKQQEEFLEWESNQAGTWVREIERLERYREKYNKKRGWSAEDLAEVEQIDKQIKECQGILYRLQEEEWYSGEESE